MLTSPPIAIVMGSQSDWPNLRHAAEILDLLKIEYEARIVSAHRTPDRMYEFARNARADGFKVIIASAGGAAHLPGMVAALTPLPAAAPRGASSLAARRRAPPARWSVHFPGPPP